MSQGKLASSWNTTPIPSGTWPVTGVPSNITLPEVAGCNPASTSNKVDLPQPEGPTTAKNSPRRSSRFTGPSALTGGLPATPG